LLPKPASRYTASRRVSTRDKSLLFIYIRAVCARGMKSRYPEAVCSSKSAQGRSFLRGSSRMTKTKSFLDLPRHVACLAGFRSSHGNISRAREREKEKDRERQRRKAERCERGGSRAESRRFRAAKTTRLHGLPARVHAAPPPPSSRDAPRRAAPRRLALTEQAHVVYE
jgi:hypothetical protein